MKSVEYYVEKWKNEGKHALLDLGCGMGNVTIPFIEHGFWVTAADPDENAVTWLRQWEKQHHKIFRSKQCGITHLPFAENAFDCIWACQCFLGRSRDSFLESMNEIRRVLRPDGILLAALAGQQKEEKEVESYFDGFEIQNMEYQPEEEIFYIEAKRKKEEKKLDYSAVLGQWVQGKIDRPLGTWHSVYKNLYYPVNYGYIEGILAGDGEEQDIYLLGEEEPVDEFEGMVVAVVHRLNDVEDKWVVDKTGRSYSAEEIQTKLDFQEKYFNSEIFVWDGVPQKDA